MNISGTIVGSGIFAAAYALSIVIYSVRIIRKYPGDRGIRFGSVTLIVALCTAVAFRIPGFGRIFDWSLPVLIFPILILVIATLYFLVKDTITDIRSIRSRKHREE
jgi:hypothetical protein